MNKLLQKTFLFFLFVTTVSQTAKSQDITTGLVAHYEFENTAGDVIIDAAGSHNGTNYGAVPVTGKIGNALKFDGTDYVEINNHADISNYSEFTLAAWVHPTSLYGSQIIISKVTAGRDFVLKFNNSTLEAHFYDGGYRFCTSISTAVNNQWVHVLCTWKNNQWKIYYNGVLEGTCDHAGYDPPWISSNMYIGSLTSTSEKLIGSIDEVRVYNRALTDTDVAALYYYNCTGGNTAWAQNGINIYSTNTGNVGIGTSSPDEKLTVKGTVHAEEVIVDLNVPAPDYVFEDNYQLWTVTDLEEFLGLNGHLPGFLPASEMECSGINLAEINMKLLKHIEELTLYIIDQERRIQKIENQNNNPKEK